MFVGFITLHKNIHPMQYKTSTENKNITYVSVFILIARSLRFIARV